MIRKMYHFMYLNKHTVSTALVLEDINYLLYTYSHILINYTYIMLRYLKNTSFRGEKYTICR